MPEKRPLPKKNFRKLLAHMVRTEAELKLPTKLGETKKDTVISCRVVLNEIKPDGVALFCNQEFHTGESISFTMEEPKRFFCAARVATCQLILESFIMTDKKYRYRVWLDFVFDDEEQRKSVAEFCKQIGADLGSAGSSAA